MQILSNLNLSLFKNFLKCFRLNKTKLEKTINKTNINKNIYRLVNTHNQLVLKEKLFLKDKYSEFSFHRLNLLSKQLSYEILNRLGIDDLNGRKIAVYCSNNYTYLISLLAIWHSNGVPLCLSKLHPINYLDYFLDDSDCKLVINGTNVSEFGIDFDKLLNEKKIVNYLLNENEFYKKISNEPNNKEADCNYNLIELENFEKEKDALLLYTSGTSGRPKAVVHTFHSLISSILTMKDSWQWKSNDSILTVLPMNHFSGLVYCLLTPYFVKAQVELMPKFNPEQVWAKLLDEKSNNINLFIGVPTVFSQMIDFYNKNKHFQNLNDNHSIRTILNRKMRIIGCGSAPLNVKTYNDWYELTGYRILERYGMTEIGMALSNPYLETNGSMRIAGCVGRPCGLAEIRIVDLNETDNNNSDSTDDSNRVLVESNLKNDKLFDKVLSNDANFVSGELQVKGPIIFKEYLNNEEQTRKSFTKDGWFKTGDTAEFDKEKKVFKIMGRTTVDVIKSGGYKISALDIEKEILANQFVDDASVMGLADSIWGQRVFALLVIKKDYISEFKEKTFIEWCKQRLPKYSVPTVIKIIDKIPRNQMGKVNKKELIKFYEKNL